MLVFVALVATLYLSANSRLDICTDLNVRGAAGNESPRTLPTAEPSLFPPGIRCSFYAGEGKERIVAVNDAGLTGPFIVGCSLIIAGTIVQIRYRWRQTKAATR
jgi:hypothetical protein